MLPVSMKEIDRVKKRFVEEGLEAALDKGKAERSHTHTKGRRGLRSPFGGAQLQQAATRTRLLVVAALGRPDGRTAVRRFDFVSNIQS
jgi:hypothetical protein